MLGLITTVAEVFNSKLICIAGFARLHLCREDVVELGDGHRRNTDLFVEIEVKDVRIIQFTEIVEALVTVTCTFIGFSKVFNISCKAFQDIFIMECTYRCVKNVGHLF